MTDTINDSLEALRDEIGEFCKECGLEIEETEFHIEISDNLEILSSSEVLGFKNLRDEILRAIAERSAEAMFFFITSNDEADIVIRIGLFRDIGTWFAWV